MATKIAIGKLRLDVSVQETIDQLGQKVNATFLPITIAHGAKLAELPLHNRDPLERLLVAQAMINGLTIVSSDPQIALYEAPVIA